MWISLLVQTLSLYAIPVIYRWDYDNLYCRATFRDEKIERLFFYFLWLPIHRSHGISNIGLWQSLLRCQTTQHHYFSFFTRIKRPTRNTHLCSGDKDISSTFCSFIWILCLLDSLHSHPNFTIWVSGMYPHYAKPIYPLFSAISSWINPIIYGFMNRSMRKEFRNTLFCRKD